MKHLRFGLILSLLALVALASMADRITANSADLTKYAHKVDPEVLTALNEAGTTDFFIWMTEKADLSPAANLPTKDEKGWFVFNTLRETAERTQKEVRAYLDEQGLEYRPFYIANKIYVVSGDENTVLSLAARSDVAQITPNHPFQLQEPVNQQPAPDSVAAIEPNITFVRADEVWGMGYDGTGTVLAGNDTGLSWTHPAIQNHYRGWNGSTANHNYNWWDATGVYPMVPNDGHGHGTHTAGTMVGDDGGANQIGMAPGAQTVHCKNMTDGGSGDDATFSECFEWDLAPWDLSGNNPNPSMAPDAITNSWGYWGGGQPQFEDEIAALQAAGIAVEVSAGNEGTGCSSLRSPGDYLQVITTGSVQHTGGVLPGTITGFSSRGPSSLYPGEYFPDVMAPGENIRSSLPGGSYEAWSGTSMAGPHVTGLIGLMWSASPALHGDIAQTYDILQDTAIRLVGQGGSNCGGNYVIGPNNDWGFGTIDAVAAVEEAILRGGPNFTLEASPEAMAICAPANALYEVNIGQILGYSYPVNLSASGNPAGTTANFSPASVVPPGSSNLTIGNTGAAAPGSYEIVITGVGTDPETKTHDDSVMLSVYTSNPSGVTLTAPANGATGVSPVPTFSWNAATQGAVYHLQVATDAGFSNVVYSASTDATSHTATAPLEPLSTYYWRVRAQNACGMGSYSATYSFTTADIPPILLVDDDDNSPNVQATYTAALDALGMDYDVWNTNNSDNEPDAATLLQYEVVIWFTGDEFGGSAGPGSAGEDALEAYLNAGTNCLFLNSQDYIYDRGVTGFMQSHLGVGTATNDVAQTTVTGQGSIYAGMGPYTLTYPFTNYSDRVLPDATAETGFTGNAGSTAINKAAGYRTIFWSFPFEALPAASRNAVLQTTLDWCGAGGPGLVAELTYQYWLNNGGSGSNMISFWDNDTFTDQTGNYGNWSYVGGQGLRFYYTDGSHCSAFASGRFQGGGNIAGLTFCTDGSGVAGIWIGNVATGAFQEPQ